jgi:hypothetical protein
MPSSTESTSTLDQLEASGPWGAERVARIRAGEASDVDFRVLEMFASLLRDEELVREKLRRAAM